jgi:hypothetical protein
MKSRKDKKNGSFDKVERKKSEKHHGTARAQLILVADSSLFCSIPNEKVERRGRVRALRQDTFAAAAADAAAAGYNGQHFTCYRVVLDVYLLLDAFVRFVRAHSLRTQFLLWVRWAGTN